MNRNSSPTQPAQDKTAPITARTLLARLNRLLWPLAVGVVVGTLATCQPAHAVAADRPAGYAGPAHKSSGPVLAGRILVGAQPAHGLFSCVAIGRPRPHGMAGWEAARLAGYLQGRSANPSSLAAQIADSGKASTQPVGA